MELGNPFIKMALEQVTNHSYFSRGEVSKIPSANFKMGEMKDFMGLRMPARIAYLAKMFPLLSEIDRINPDAVFGKASVDEQTGQRTTSRAKFTPWWQDEATLRETRFNDMDGMPRFIAWLSGMRTFTYDPDATIPRKVQQNVRAINKTKAELLYYIKQAQKAGNVDAAAELIKTYEMFGGSGYETDPLQYGIDTTLMKREQEEPTSQIQWQ